MTGKSDFNRYRNHRLQEADQLMKQGAGLINTGKELMQKAVKIYEDVAVKSLREQNDKLINRKEAIQMLWFNSYPTLREWEEKMRPYGYLEFQDDKILRSELLRFLDDYNSGKIKKMLYKKG